MPGKKKSHTDALPMVVSPVTDVVRIMNGTGELAKVDAVYHVAAVHPSAEGPWMTEADKIAWTDPMTGYGCIIRRSPNGRHLCGYVSVPPSHPLFGRGFRTLAGIGIGIHGGLDYSAECEQRESEDRSVCHVVKRTVADDFKHRVHANAAADRHDDAWWFGFSCDQRTDIVPDLGRSGTRGWKEPRLGVEDPSYKTEGFVFEECVRLAVQLKAIGDGRDPTAADPGPTPIARPATEFGR